MSETNRMFNLYMEIAEFLHSGGGPYAVMDGLTLDNLIESLYSGQYILHRDPAGKIKSFCNYWLIEPEDVSDVKNGKTPPDVNAGTVVMVLDHVNRAGHAGLYDIIQELRQRHPNIKGAAWFHKRAIPEQFRYFPSQRGANGQKQ